MVSLRQRIAHSCLSNDWDPGFCQSGEVSVNGPNTQPKMPGQLLGRAQGLGLEIKDLGQQAINTVHGRVIVNACPCLVARCSSLHHWHHEARGMLGVAVDAVSLFHFLTGVAPGLAGAGVHVEAGVVAGGDRHAEAVAGVEDLAGGPAIDGDFFDLAWDEWLELRGGLAMTEAYVSRSAYS